MWQVRVTYMPFFEGDQEFFVHEYPPKNTPHFYQSVIREVQNGRALIIGENLAIPAHRVCAIENIAVKTEDL